jgi:hypothetical protein
MGSLGLAGRIAGQPSGIGQHFLALQGQDLPGCLWALGTRAAVDRETVAAAFNRGELVRGWPMRGTLHVTPAKDLGWLNTLVPWDRTARATERCQKYLELPSKKIKHLSQTVVDLMHQNGPMTRNALFTA